MEKVKKASFSIEKYYFEQVHIDIKHYQGEELFIDFEPSGEFGVEHKIYNLSFVFSACTSDEDNIEPFVKVKCVGVFKFNEVNSLEEIPEFFYRNSIAILFPYLRAYVSIITNQANIGQVMLPTLNLSSLEKPLRENTTIK